MTRFPDYSVKECVEVYGILGGVPAYLGDWNEKRSVKENIINLFLHKNGRLYHEGESFLKTQLRELSAYSTILSYLAQGKTQLTELYELTGFSRAKVSVYLKNLMALDVVEKVTSYEIKAKENTKKGVYRLRDTCLLFWYRFVYPNLSKLEERKMEEVYDKEILPALEDYLELSFSKVCREYMRLLSDYKKLPFRIKALDSWQGKTGELKLIGQGDDGALFVGGCKWSEEPLKEEDFIEILHLSEQAKVKPDYYYLFSKSGFASSLEVKTKGMENVILMDLEDM
jgi:AAA+ ATPase superfamily predicted ATPase